MHPSLNTGAMHLSFHSHWFLTSDDLTWDDYLMFCGGQPL